MKISQISSDSPSLIGENVVSSFLSNQINKLQAAMAKPDAESLNYLMYLASSGQQINTGNMLAQIIDYATTDPSGETALNSEKYWKALKKAFRYDELPPRLRSGFDAVKDEVVQALSSTFLGKFNKFLDKLNEKAAQTNEILQPPNKKTSKSSKGNSSRNDEKYFKIAQIAQNMDKYEAKDYLDDLKDNGKLSEKGYKKVVDIIKKMSNGDSTVTIDDVVRAESSNTIDDVITEGFIDALKKFVASPQLANKDARKKALATANVKMINLFSSRFINFIQDYLYARMKDRGVDPTTLGKLLYQYNLLRKKGPQSRSKAEQQRMDNLKKVMLKSGILAVKPKDIEKAETQQAEPEQQPEALPLTKPKQQKAPINKPWLTNSTSGRSRGGLSEGRLNEELVLII